MDNKKKEKNIPEIIKNIFLLIRNLLSLPTLISEIIFKDKTGKTQGIKLRIIPPSKARKKK
tara:strand:+ start:241 stop:423 length:183 start_codon:yes stop_codon:yes gene_type:complete